MSSVPPGYPPPPTLGTSYQDLAQDYLASAKEQWGERSQAVKNFIVDRPVIALGVALGMGVAFGWLIKRR